MRKPKRSPTHCSKASDLEIAHRYLAWLSLERRMLAHELGRRDKDGKTLVILDDLVEDFFYPLISGRRGAVRSSARAAKVLRAAGISVDHYPEHAYFGKDRPRRGAA